MRRAEKKAFPGAVHCPWCALWVAPEGGHLPMHNQSYRVLCVGSRQTEAQSRHQRGLIDAMARTTPR
jgi:hypothetical protein